MEGDHALTPEEEFAEFQAFKRMKAAQTGGPLAPVAEAPKPTIGEVLKALVNSARLPSEEIVRQYHAAIDEAFPVKKDETEEATHE